MDCESISGLIEHWVADSVHFSRVGLAQLICVEYGSVQERLYRDLLLPMLLGWKPTSELLLEYDELNYANDFLREHPEIITLALNSLRGELLRNDAEAFIRKSAEFTPEEAFEHCFDSDAGILVSQLIFSIWVLCTARTVGCDEDLYQRKAEEIRRAHDTFLAHSEVFYFLDVDLPINQRY